MTEDEDRLRELLRAPLPGATGDAEPVRLAPVRAVGRRGRLTMLWWRSSRVGRSF